MWSVSYSSKEYGLFPMVTPLEVAALSPPNVFKCFSSPPPSHLAAWNWTPLRHPLFSSLILTTRQRTRVCSACSRQALPCRMLALIIRFFPMWMSPLSSSPLLLGISNALISSLLFWSPFFQGHLDPLLRYFFRHLLIVPISSTLSGSVRPAFCDISTLCGPTPLHPISFAKLVPFPLCVGFYTVWSNPRVSCFDWFFVVSLFTFPANCL